MSEMQFHKPLVPPFSAEKGQTREGVRKVQLQFNFSLHKLSVILYSSHLPVGGKKNLYPSSMKSLADLAGASRAEVEVSEGF